MAFGARLTQLDHEDHDRAVVFTSQMLMVAKQNYTANERRVTALISALQRFWCYLEGSTFDVLTDNQVVMNLLTKKLVNRREARWLDMPTMFNI